ncbi:MAG: peptidase C25 [Flavobacteriaceae bacterium]|nr:peptidase C25 [Flavobacteriaceae bacterium]
MRKIVLFCAVLLLSVVSAWSQNRNIEIDWDSQKSVTRATGFSSENAPALPRAKGILYLSDTDLDYSERWEDEAMANPASLVISNVSFQPATGADLQQANRDLIPSEVAGSLFSATARGKIYTTLSVAPLVNRNGSIQKITSFSVSYSYLRQSRSGAGIPLSSSVLATGQWFKFKVDRTGVHKIDKRFLEDLGMNVGSINPRNLKLFGNGGKPLPLLNAENTVFDLPETPIQVIGEADGSFDSGDYILFYGTNTKGYDYENDSHLNPYSNDSYYYVTADGAAGKRVQPMVEPSAAPTVTIQQFHDVQFHEVDEESPARVGRRWYGNRFTIENEQSYEFVFPNIASGTPMRVMVRAAAASETSTSMAISVNSTTMNPLNFSPVSGQTYVSPKLLDEEVPAAGETVTVDLTYNNGGNPSSIGYLDYVQVEALRQLTGVGGQLQFRNNDTETLSGIGEYQIANAAQFTQVWDVTNPAFISSKVNEGGASSLTLKAPMGVLRTYVAVNPNDYFVPVQVADARVPNQDIKGTIFKDASGAFQDIDYVIITAPFLLQPALRLANHHKNVSGLRVKVVTTDKIYEEFSSGKQDIGAIRNFVRYVYENASSPSNRIKYLGIFGDTSIDYKNRLPNNNNVVPTFHTLLSTNTISSFMSDDFFGNMDIDEGTIGLENDGRPGPERDIDLLDIAVGRILADNVSLANAMVDKIVNYTSKETYGNWRNNFVLVSDDVDKASDRKLQEDLDALGDTISAKKPFINVKKIHSDAFRQQSSAGGDRYPEVNEAIKDAIDVGAVLFNYFGHGGEDGLANEFIYNQEIARNLQNKNRLPCIVTVTCEFTKFDDPQRITAGELTYMNREGGAISLVTTTRSIGIFLGVEFNKALAEQLFGYGLEVPNTPAEGLRVSKNNISNDLRRVVFYIGDPAMRLAFPRQSVRLTTLNGVPISQATDTLKALSKVRVGGEVVNENGQLLTDYNGVVETKIFDKNVQRQTLDNDNQGVIMNFTTLGEGLFNGQASVVNGKFEVEFVVPRDIQIPVGKGRVSLYARRDNALEDQTGSNLDLKVGGLNENAPEDNIGPTISLFMNDESFVSGGVTNDSPILLAKLEDENGINTASGIGHDIIAILDGDEANPFVLNDYYQTDIDDFTKGTANYKLRDLEEGVHTLTVRAWDVYNNSSTSEIQFVVAGDDQLKITRVLNYPNPFVSYTEFWFNHNRPFEQLDVQVQVFTVTGKVVWTKNQMVNTDGFLSRDIVWDGRDDFGDRIGKGVYVYKITVKSTLTNQQTEKFEKLVIL